MSEEVLQQAVEAALQEYRQAQKEFEALVAETPMGSGSDGVSLQQASQKTAAALERFRDAAMKYHGFLTRTIP